MNTYIAADQVKLVHSGPDYFDTLERMIGESKNVLHLQTYIFDSDNTGKRIVEALKTAAQRGVEIYVLLDAFGSQSFSSRLQNDLKTAGIKFRFFAPLFSSESIFFGRRLHHKIIVADQTTALVGGINIADKYSQRDDHVQPWLDYAVLIKGEAAFYLHQLCECFFERKGFSDLRRLEKKYRKTNEISDQTYLIRFRRNDWLRRKNEIHKSYMEALSGAKKSITIVASYFLPGINFRRLLRRAFRKGVDVKVILAGKSDVSSVRLAESYLYGFYLRSKIKIYEWHNSVMHGKMMIIDDEWCTVGSYNLNYLSHYISIELNVDIKSKTFAGEIKRHFKTITDQDCVLVDLEHFRQKYGLVGKFKLWIAYMFHKVVQGLMMSGKRFRN